jgi:alanine-synthesizing transaminase
MGRDALGLPSPLVDFRFPAMPHRQLPASERLRDVRYEIRGELAHRARELEAQGRSIVRLNIGNPGAFGFETPAHLREAVAAKLARSEAYCQEQGLLEARAAVVAQQRERNAPQVCVEHTFIGNGVSELIDLSLRALLNPGDEVLVPAPDYPLWTASVILNGGRAVHYDCAAERGFLPDPDAIEAQITPRTRALVVINPNNPTGAVYPRELLARLAEIATRHRLVLMADEIYDGILYDQARFHPLAALAPDTLCLSFGGLSKVHRACGYRIGWLSLSGQLNRAHDYVHGLVLLAALRLCSNVTAQWAVAPALTGPDTISALTAPGGRLHETRRALLETVAQSALLRVVQPEGALYAFPQVDRTAIADFDDHAFALELLETESVLLVPGSSFNVPYRNHFRVTLLPPAAQMREVFGRIERALARVAERGTMQRHVA